MKNRPKKNLGQNFLIDKNIINLIVDLGKINQNDNVLEVGPGTGNLTEAILLKKPKKLIVIEKDKSLALVLEKKFNKNNIIVAYEPIWSIGTGKIPNQKDLLKTTIHIKKVLKKIFRKNSPPVLYGGSVDENNIDMFREIKEIDGFLIGGASKSSKKFIDIIKNYYR